MLSVDYVFGEAHHAPRSDRLQIRAFPLRYMPVQCRNPHPETGSGLPHRVPARFRAIVHVRFLSQNQAPRWYQHQRGYFYGQKESARGAATAQPKCSKASWPRFLSKRESENKFTPPALSARRGIEPRGSTIRAVICMRAGRSLASGSGPKAV